MSKVLSIQFFQDTDPKLEFFNDVTITSSLHSVVQVLIGHFTIFQSGWFVQKIMKRCQNLSKLRPKHCQSLFSGHGVDRRMMVLEWENVLHNVKGKVELSRGAVRGIRPGGCPDPQKWHSNLRHNFGKCRSIFKILWSDAKRLLTL